MKLPLIKILLFIVFIDEAVLIRRFLQVGFLTTFAILLHEIPHEVRKQSS